MRTWTDFVDGCPDCKSTEITLLESEVFGTEYKEHYECLECGLMWCDVFEYDRSFVEGE